MNKALVLLISSLALSASLAAMPSVASDAGWELFATASASLRYDDNVFLSDSGRKVSDTAWEFEPGLELAFGSASIHSGKVYFIETITRYVDQSQLKNNLAQVGVAGSFDDPKLRTSYNASFAQMAPNTYDIRTVDSFVRRDVYNAGFNSEYSMSEKTSLGVGVTYGDINYKIASFTDTRTLSVPVNLYFKVDAKLDSSVGLSYRSTTIQKGRDSKDWFLNVGARGEFTPKLSGRVAIGYVRRSTSGMDSDGSLGIDASLAYSLSPKSTANIAISNDFGASGYGQNQKNFRLTGALASKLSAEWNLGGSLSYCKVGYLGQQGFTSHTDDYIEGSLSASYAINRHASVAASYSHRNYGSRLAGADFSSNVYALTANFRY